MLTLIVLIAAALFAGVRPLTFVYYKKNDASLAQIDADFAGRLREGNPSEHEKTRPIQ
ncbi:hypothetical protein LJK88_20090 [Paenibacillus sp. P26]|nr:hypothetical protein LJK88_20090 [Paenibacillus sp. P26]UUZ96050.1 hypothetical protein LJK87_17770 [Paenibacillus sp. P25]